MLEERSQEGPVVVVDAGNLFWKTAKIPENDLAQRRIKAALIAEAYAKGGVDAMGFGAGDLALGTDHWWGLVTEHKLPVTAANLQCSALSIPGSLRVERGGKVVGFVGLTEAAPDGCALTDEVAATQAAVAALGPVDVLILLSTLESDAERRVTAAVPEVDFVINGSQSLTHAQARALEGGAWQLGSGDRGKRVGVLSLSFTSGAESWLDEGAAGALAKRLDQYRTRLASTQAELPEAEDERARSRLERRIEVYERQISELEADLAASTSGGGLPHSRFNSTLVELDDKGGEVTEIAGMVAQTKLKIEELSEAPREGAPFASKAFVGSSYCQGCHPAAFQQWQSTPHARAYSALTKERRNLDNDCYSCHVTGAFHPDGPQTAKDVGSLKDVGCEACHGPGAEHVKDPKGHPLPAEVEASTCTGCHDGVRDDGQFDLGVYLPQVSHGG